MPLIQSPKKIAVLFCLPALLIAILYSPTLSFSLVWDDYEWVGRIMAQKNDFPSWAIHAFTRESLGVYYRPIALLSFYYPFDAPVPVFFWHLINYCLYIIDIFLLGIIFFGLYLKSDSSISTISQESKLVIGIAILLFTALHPTQVETISWISCRFDLMSNTFLLCIIVIEVFGSRRLYQHILQALLFFLALASKESAIVFLGIYPVFHYFLNPGNAPSFSVSLRKNYRSIMLLVTSAVLYCFIWLNIADFSGFLSRIQLTPIYNDYPSHLYTVLATLGYFARLLLYPFIELSPYYYHEGIVKLTNPHVWLGGMLVMLFLFALIKKWKILPVLTIFLLAALPFLNWSQISSTGDIVQNRYLSLPLLMGSCALYLFMLRNRLPFYLARYSIIMIPYIFFTGFTAVSILPLWKNDLSLWNWVVTENPASFYARGNLASQLKIFKEYDAALKQLEISLELKENFWAYSGISQILWLKGDYENANKNLLKSLEYAAIMDDKATFLLDMANKNFELGNNDIALFVLQRMATEHLDAEEPFKSQHRELLKKVDKTNLPEP